jgi:hypothetical protein
MTPSPRNVLLLGDPALDEFREAIETIRQQVPGEHVRAATGAEDLAALVGAGGWHPDLIVVLQSWPDQFSENDIHKLLAICPLARIVCCFGSWCDSDGRTRSIWPLAVRIPIVAARRRLIRELALLENHDGSSVPLPLTASRSEIFENDYTAPADSALEKPPAGAVSVFSPDWPFRQMLEAAARDWGYRLHEASRGAAPEVILFDADPWDAQRMITLRTIRENHPQARLVACVGFPRPDLDAALREKGADDMWFKLSPLADLKFVMAGLGHRRESWWSEP